MLVKCPECGGTGNDIADEMLSTLADKEEIEKCWRCKGEGMIQWGKETGGPENV